MAKMTRDNFGELLTPVHKKVFFEAYGEKPEQWSRVFKTDSMEKKEETFPHMGAFGMWDQNTEGNTINESNISEGEKATLTATRYDNGYEVTWELVQDDLYNVLRGLGRGGSAKGLGRGLRARIETVCADHLNDGFGNTGYDGVATFSNSHPLADSTSTGDNLTTGDLDDANLKTGLTLMREQVDEANIKIQAVAKDLIVPNELEWTGMTLIESAGQAGIADNDKNVLPRLNLVVMDYLTDADAWFLRDPSFENLMFLWREKPFFDSERIQKTVDHFMFGYTRFATGVIDYRGLVGSQGA